MSQGEKKKTNIKNCDQSSSHSFSPIFLNYGQNIYPNGIAAVSLGVKTKSIDKIVEKLVNTLEATIIALSC